MNLVGYTMLLAVAMLHVSGMLADADSLDSAAPDFDKRRGWGKRAEDALEGEEIDKRRGWGKRADEEMDKRRGWGKRSASLSTHGDGVDAGDTGTFYTSLVKRRGWGKRAGPEDLAWAREEVKRRGWGKRADICEEINDKIYAHVAKAVEVGECQFVSVEAPCL